MTFLIYSLNGNQSHAIYLHMYIYLFTRINTALSSVHLMSIVLIHVHVGQLPVDADHGLQYQVCLLAGGRPEAFPFRGGYRT